jgi:GTP-binding protein YchF
MEVGIVGLPAVGKTTLFNALTGGHAEAFSEKTHVGVADVPDPHLGVIASYITTKKIVPATIRFVDIPGVAADAGAKKLNTFLEQIRQVDAICHVVRCFDDGSGTIDPAGAIEAMETELVLADLVVTEGATDKASRTARSGDPDAKARLAVLEKVAAVLEGGAAVRTEPGWSEAERRILGGYGFITAKPVLYVANTEEGETGSSPTAEVVRGHAESSGSGSVTVCAKLEAELAELDPADRDEMLESLGLAEPAIGPLARAANAVLGLRTFYTAGDKEVRAWTIRAGAHAPDAAGAIHSDIQRGFIRAECYTIDDLVRHETEKAIRDAGKLRSEGKAYEVQEGDVVHFLFNV